MWDDICIQDRWSGNQGWQGWTPVQSIHHLAVWKPFVFHDWKIREDEALRVPYHPLITLRRYSNSSQDLFTGSASTTFPSSPPWGFSSFKSLDCHHANDNGEDFPCFYLLFPAIRLSASCISPLSEEDALLEDAAALSQLSHSLPGFQAQVRDEIIIFLP